LTQFGLIRRSAEFTSHDEFIDYWVNKHSVEGRKLPGLRKYSIYDLHAEVGAEEPRWDCIVEMWFDDREAYEKAFKSGEWKSGDTKDRHTNAERIILLSDSEHRIISPPTGDR
jgi:uncharacterized protein (TIGR02118 family)